MNANLTIGQVIAWARSTVDTVIGLLYWLAVAALIFLFACMVGQQFTRIGWLPYPQPATFIYLAGAAWLLKR